MRFVKRRCSHLEGGVCRQLDNGDAMPGSVGEACQARAALKDGRTCPRVQPQPQPSTHKLQLQAVAGGRVVGVEEQTITRFCPELKTQT